MLTNRIILLTKKTHWKGILPFRFTNFAWSTARFMALCPARGASVRYWNGMKTTMMAHVFVSLYDPIESTPHTYHRAWFLPTHGLVSRVWTYQTLMLSLVLNSHPPCSEKASDEILQLPSSTASRICEKYGDSVPRNSKKRPPRDAEHTEREHVGASYTELPKNLRRLLEPHMYCRRNLKTQTILFLNVTSDPPFRIMKHPHLSFDDIRVAALMYAAIRHDAGILDQGAKKWLSHLCACTDNIHSWWSSVT